MRPRPCPCRARWQGNRSALPIASPDGAQRQSGALPRRGWWSASVRAARSRTAGPASRHPGRQEEGALGPGDKPGVTLERRTAALPKSRRPSPPFASPDGAQRQSGALPRRGWWSDHLRAARSRTAGPAARHPGRQEEGDVAGAGCDAETLRMIQTGVDARLRGHDGCGEARDRDTRDVIPAQAGIHASLSKAQCSGTRAVALSVFLSCLEASLNPQVSRARSVGK